jgi:hypothetical protein
VAALHRHARLTGNAISGKPAWRSLPSAVVFTSGLLAGSSVGAQKRTTAVWPRIGVGVGAGDDGRTTPVPVRDVWSGALWPALRSTAARPDTHPAGGNMGIYCSLSASLAISNIPSHRPCPTSQLHVRGVFAHSTFLTQQSPTSLSLEDSSHHHILTAIPSHSQKQRSAL